MIDSPRYTSAIYYSIIDDDPAEIYETQNQQSTRADCQTLISNAARQSFIMEAKEGAAACIVTTEGRLAFVRVEKMDPYGWGSIEVTFVTWKKK